MLTIKLFGDKQGEKFAWSITVEDSRGTFVFTDGIDASVRDAKACMHAALGALVETLEFVPVDEDARTS
jgi:hypothetical protein